MDQSEERITEGKITEGKIPEDKISEDRITEDKISQDRVSENRLTENRLSEKYQSLNRSFEDYARAVGLTSMSLTVLGIIYDNPKECTQKLICEQSQYTKQSVNMIIKAFWKHGYVELVEMKTDRRNKQVKLSESGMEYADRIVGRLWKVERDVMNKITEEQREALMVYAEVYEESIRDEIARLSGNINKNEIGGDNIDKR